MFLWSAKTANTMQYSVVISGDSVPQFFQVMIKAFWFHSSDKGLINRLLSQ